VKVQPPPNLLDYAHARAGFSWDAARAALDGLGGWGPESRGLNIAHEAVDRHAAGARAETVALCWLGRDGSRREIS
jgi:acetyl-CoA synthetase